MNPETFPENKARIRREIVDAAKDTGTLLPAILIDSLVEIVVADCTELRERISTRIIGQLIDRGEPLTTEQLEKLAYIVIAHYETHDGFIDIVEPEVKPKLRKVK